MVVALPDLHLTDRGPRWRTDKDFFEFQMSMLRHLSVSVLANHKKHGATVLLPGDLFDHRRESNDVVVGFADYVIAHPWIHFVGTLGQHDFAAKSVETYEAQSSLYLAESIACAANNNFHISHSGDGIITPHCEVVCYAFGETDDLLHNPKHRITWAPSDAPLRIVLAHASVGDEHIEVNGVVRQWGVKNITCCPSADVLVLGDIHTGVSLTKIKGQDTRVLGCGVLTWMRRSEVHAPPRYAVITPEEIFFRNFPHPEPQLVGWFGNEEEDVSDETLSSLQEVLDAVAKARRSEYLTDEELLAKVAAKTEFSKEAVGRALELLRSEK